MENLIVVFDKTRPDLTEIGEALNAFAVLADGAERLIVRDDGVSITIEIDDHPASWWFDAWPDALRVPHPRALVVSYRNLETAKRVMLALARHFTFTIDTDTEGVYTSQDFAVKTEREPRWDWRAEIDARASSFVRQPAIP